MQQIPFLRFLGRLISVFLWVIAIAGFYFIYNWSLPVAVFLALAVPLRAWFYRPGKIFPMAAAGFLVMITCLWGLTPSNDRDWATGFSVLPKVSVADHQLTIEGFRNFRWRGPNEFDPVWETRSFDLRKLQSLDLIVEPFQDSELMAHVMLGFGFGEDGYLIVSVEARAEKDEKYNLLAGAFRQYELIYLFGSESDILAVRAVHRGAKVYMFPIKAEQKFKVDLLMDLASSANALRSQPKFYRSIRDNCTTVLVKHFDRLQPQHIGLRHETLFPALTGQLLHRLGYMDTAEPYEKAKEHFRVDERIRKAYGY